MNSFILIDKPEGKGSFDCIRILRKLSGEKRIGFIGTLDPLATGLMIFAFGEATKLIPYLEKADKVYEVTIRLGAESDTYDAQGKIREIVCERVPTLELIRRLIDERFIGEQEQVPPSYSAIHVDGKRAYDLARKGEKVCLKARKVVFHSVKIHRFEWPHLELTVHCGSGTYIRSLAHDLGKALGGGGYVEVLRRTAIASYRVEKAVSLERLDVNNLTDNIVSPIEFFSDWKRLELDDKSYMVLANGGFIENESGLSGGPIMAVYKGVCAGVLELHDGKLKFARKFNIYVK